MHFEVFLLLTGSLLLISVFASKISSRFGIPALLIFVLIGMLAGSEGPLGIEFSDYTLTHNLGYLALVLILFGGGLDTHWHEVRSIIRPGLALATIGVAVTAAVVGISAHFILGLSFPESLLLGAVVSSTDAAAVFGVLRAQNLRLKKNLTPLLELESGGNDPMAVFLTIALTAVVLHPGDSLWPLIPQLVTSMVGGIVSGIIVGRGAAWLINRIHLAYDGLYNVFTIAVALIAFAGTNELGGNGFLAVYTAGVALSAAPFVHRISLIQFHEGLAWLMQIAMFLTLGLLVFPSHLVPQLYESIALAVVLVLIARPVAVWLSLAFFPSYNFSEKAFISWVGLRGAVPIILATIPLMSGVPNAPLLFNVVFFVVLFSVAVQGTSIRWIARLLGIIAEGTDNVSERIVSSVKLEVKIPFDSPVVGKSVVELSLPPEILLVLHTRHGVSQIPRGNTTLHEGDVLLVQADTSYSETVRKIFDSP